ncbi:MAG: Flp pilus assembly complex ATPase component TadA [Planctomycetes bacterium]|nr:Flp pilus assembly complex ATPase component TadA [Planctomycetota bacterium]MBL7143944.1 Flp pilus assembly complex ATPase component TadA [Phycisphaerae bacterium]
MASAKTISKISEAQATLPFGELLVSKGLLTREELEKVLDEQSQRGGRLGEILLRLEKLNHEDVTLALAEHLSMEYIRLGDTSKMNVVDMDIARLLPESIAKRFCLVAINEVDDKVVVVMADPLNVVALDTVALKIKRQIKPAISSPREIQKTIELIYHGSDLEEQQLRTLVEGEVDQEGILSEEADESDISGEEDANKAPVIRFVDLLMSQAVKSRASDVHIEPQEKTMMVRMRIDGVLRDMVPPAKKMQAAVIARIKIIARMDIAERRLPQDGRFKIKTSGRHIDVRVSVIPTIYGEKVVMRILDASAVKHELEQLGLEPKLLEEFKGMLTRPHGIMIVTGPTGSGKSTTLYSALNYVKDPTKNITTVEDPVEYRLGGINQIQIKPEIELDFAKCLRAILRQDPDIILIGEIRDKETVEIAIKASLTGHLVLSTFHTNDAPSAISRLLYMGIERYLLASSLNLIVAQRLVRKICEHCKEPVTLSEEVLKRLKIDPKKTKNPVFYHGKGCSACGGSGCLGRLPIFEFLVMDDEIRDLIVAGSSEQQIREASRKRGYGGLLESGVNKALAGLTTAEEVISVAYTG